MGQTPLTAQYRVRFVYNVLDFEHKLDLYLRCAASADASGYNTVARPGMAAVGVSTVKDALWNKLKVFYTAANTAFGRMELQLHSGDAWNVLWTGTTAVSPTGAEGEVKAQMCTFFRRTTTHVKGPLYLYEFGPATIDKQEPNTGMGTGTKDFLDAISNYYSTAANADPWAWAVGRDNQWFGPVTNVIWDSNEKLRRLRHIK